MDDHLNEQKRLVEKDLETFLRKNDEAIYLLENNPKIRAFKFTAPTLSGGTYELIIEREYIFEFREKIIKKYEDDIRSINGRLWVLRRWRDFSERKEQQILPKRTVPKKEILPIKKKEPKIIPDNKPSSWGIHGIMPYPPKWPWWND